MKIAFLYSPWCLAGRYLNFFRDNIDISTRGLSGSDLTLVETAKNFVQMGHEVHLFTVHAPGTKPDIWEGVHLHDWEEAGNIDNSYDCLLSLMAPDVFRGLPTRPVRLCLQTLNDWTYTQDNFDSFVDIWTCPSQPLRDHLHKLLPPEADRQKWHVVPLGCYPDSYNPKKVPGRIVSISSADRGLHLFLSQWHRIKAAVPHAELHVYYHLENTEGLEQIEPYEAERHPDILSLAQRVRYIKYAMQKLEPLGVKYLGSASQVEIIKALNKAQAAVCPLSTVSWTEGFSCSTLQVLASQTFPIVGNIDALGDLYGEVAPLIPAPVEENLDEMVNLTIKALTDQSYWQEVTERGLSLAKDWTWQSCSKQLEKLILEHPKFNSDKPIGTKLNIGCGPNIFLAPGWTNLDRQDLNHYFQYVSTAPLEGMPEVQQKLALYLRQHGYTFEKFDLRQGFSHIPNDSVDLITAQQVIEHLNPIYEAPKFLAEMYRILRPGGYLRLTTPDLNLLIQAYLKGEMAKFKDDQPEFYQKYDSSAQLAFLMYGASDPSCVSENYLGHYFLFTETSMRKFLQDAGFNTINFYRQAGESDNETIKNEIIDSGMSHSFAVDAIK